MAKGLHLARTSTQMLQFSEPEVRCIYVSWVLGMQDSRKLKEASLLDQLLLTPKQLRLKQYRETK